MIVAQEIAAKELDTHLPELATLVRAAWSDVEMLPDSFRVVMTPRTRACAVHDFMVARAAGYATSADGVRIFERQSMHGIVVDDKYAIRFKKFDEDGLSKNQPTIQVTEFRSQLELDGIDAVHHLEVGYVLNAFGTDITDILVTCPAGKGNAWAMSLKSQQAKTVVADIFENVPAQEPVEGVIIKPRQTGGDVIPFRKNEEK